MDDQLLLLRKGSYAAGMKHDQALRNCSDALLGRDYAAAELAVAHHTEVADQYGKALLRLAEHLATLDQSVEVVDEAKRVQRLLELLDSEVETVQRRLDRLTKTSD